MLGDLKCDCCNQQILSTYISTDSGLYHESCFYNHIQLKCDVCKSPISGNYFIDEYGCKVCNKHSFLTCSTCGKYIDNHDYVKCEHRSYCKSCSATLVTLTDTVKKVYNEICAVYNQYGLGNWPKGILISLVDAKTLGNELTSSEILGKASCYYHSSIFKQAKNHQIQILYGLPIVEFKSVLGHELLHVWQYERNMNLSDVDAEGFCNLGAYLLLSLENSKVAERLMRRMKDDPDPIYGNGFRKILSEVQQKGWINLFVDLKSKGQV